VSSSYLLCCLSTVPTSITADPVGINTDHGVCFLKLYIHRHPEQPYPSLSMWVFEPLSPWLCVHVVFCLSCSRPHAVAVAVAEGKEAALRHMAQRLERAKDGMIIMLVQSSGLVLLLWPLLMRERHNCTFGQ
jgi:hypothetical protein